MKRLITLLLALAVLGAVPAPAQEYVPTPVTLSKEKVKLGGKVYLSHVVLERQTLYGIAKAYGVTEEELYEANPTLRETGLQKNAILLVPFKEVTAEEPAPAPQDPSFIEHTVRWYEDLDDIARRYDVSAKAIMEANGLKSRKLTTRQVLKIPVSGSTVEMPEPDEDDAQAGGDDDNPAEEAPVPVIPAAEPDTTLLQLHAPGSVEFALVLPLNAGGKTNENNMDFYAGALMALRDLEAEGVKAQMHVHDLSAGIPLPESLSRCDFVLGPVATRDLENVLERADGRVPVISPLDQKAIALSARFHPFIQVPAATENQYEDLAQWVKEESRPGDGILLVSEKGAGNVSAAVAIRSALARRDLNYEILNYAIVEGRGIPAILTESMTLDGVNRVVVASESEAFVGDVVRNLGIMLGKGYKVVMYAPSKVRTFDTIDGSAYHQASLHICTPYHADYSDPAVDRFVRAYRSLFRTEPSQFAFQGYDTARYFAHQCARYGHAWTQYTGAERYQGLQTDFRFETDAQGNQANVAVRRIVFEPDFTTSLQR